MKKRKKKASAPPVKTAQDMWREHMEQLQARLLEVEVTGKFDSSCYGDAEAAKSHLRLMIQSYQNAINGGI